MTGQTLKCFTVVSATQFGNEIYKVGAYEHDDGATLDWQCPKCGATGKAGYTFVFDRHSYVQDVGGNEVK